MALSDASRSITALEKKLLTEGEQVVTWRPRDLLDERGEALTGQT